MYKVSQTDPCRGIRRTVFERLNLRPKTANAAESRNRNLKGQPMAHISQELREEIRSRVITDEEEARQLLELYELVDYWYDEMVRTLTRDYSDTDPLQNGVLREGLRNVHSVIRLKMDLQRELRTISRPTRTVYEGDQEEDRDSDNEGIQPKVTASRKPTPTAKNRQHRNRVSKRHNRVSNES